MIWLSVTAKNRSITVIPCSVSNTHDVPVSVVLKDAEGVAIASWDLQAKQSLNISAKDIATSSGTIEITGDGVSETKTVTFTKQ